MPHYPKPWFRRDRGSWFVQVNGKQVNLGADKDGAFKAYHALLAAPKPVLRTGSPLVAELIDLFLEWCQKHRAPRSYDFYRERCQSFLDVDPRLTIEELRPFHVQQWADSKAWSDGMKRGAMMSVQRALNWCVQFGHLRASPIVKLVKPPQGVRDLIISPERYAEILKLVKDQAFRDLLGLAWETGARPQELLRIEARHVDLANSRLVFPAKEAKGKKRIRIVYLTETAMLLVRKLLMKHPEGMLLRNIDGNPWQACAVTELDRKFTLDVATMPPAASAYFRKRAFLTPEVCGKWRVGYLSRGTGDDKSGGTMRGKIVYPYFSDAGEVLTWFGRDPDFEEKHWKWEQAGKTEREPEKFHFVKGFHRGIELFGQHLLHAEGIPDKLKGLGLVVVEGPNDVIRLDTLGIPAVGLCSNTITREQTAKIARLAREVAHGIVTVFLDCDPEGENGMRQCLGYLAQLIPVRLAWTSKMYDGKFRGRQPESLGEEEWGEIRAFLAAGPAPQCLPQQREG